MNFRVKSIIKKVALVLAGVTAITAAGFGVKALVDYTQDDLKTISPTFEVGNLGSDGKFVADESTLYTKEAFEAEGLQIKLDFDNQINYQIFYYDDLDNFVESTEVLSTAYSETVHDGYARIVITPTDDEDEKISLVERITYPGQMEIKVNKKQDVTYHNVDSNRLYERNDISDLRFNLFDIQLSSDGKITFVDVEGYAATTRDLLKVRGGTTITFNIPEANSNSSFYVYEFKEIDSNHLKLVSYKNSKDIQNIILNKETEFVLFSYCNYDSSDVKAPIDSLLLSKIKNFISISK